MGQVVQMPVSTGGLTRRDPRRLALFRNGPGKELLGSEIDEAIEWCEIFQANPFVKDIYFFVFDANKPTRNVVPVLGIGLYRKIAARTGNYLPDENPPVFTYDESLKSDANPSGIVDCTARLKVYRHGDWHWVSERIRWDERAPIKEIWENNQPTGKFRLDPKKKNWREMPETMHAKCTEVALIRKAFPNETAGSYAPEELDWVETIEGTATDITNRYEAELRQKVIGGPSVTLDWCDGTPLAFVSVGKVHDLIEEWLSDPDNSAKAQLFRDRNVVGLREYWAHDKAAALHVRTMLDEAIKSAEAAE